MLPGAPCPGWSHHTPELRGAERWGTGYIMPVTNAIESINAQLRRAVKTRGHFPSDEAATKLLWLVLRNITGAWGSATHDWKAAMNQFAVIYAERFTDPYR